MKEIVDMGINSFKFFMAYKGALMVGDELLLDGMQRCKQLGALAMVCSPYVSTLYVTHEVTQSCKACYSPLVPIKTVSTLVCCLGPMYAE